MSLCNVQWFSPTLGKQVQSYVILPDTGKGPYAVFYLLHGAGDSDDSWTSVGRAGMIMDNLIAAGKANNIKIVQNPSPPGLDRWTLGTQ